MPLLLVWIVFCCAYVWPGGEKPLYSLIAEVLLLAAAGFFVFGMGWVYQSFWARVSPQGLRLKLYRALWWPVSPLFYVLGGELVEVGKTATALYCAAALITWFVFRQYNFRLYATLIQETAEDARLMASIKSRSDMWWMDAAYWGILSWHFLV